MKLMQNNFLKVHWEMSPIEICSFYGSASEARSHLAIAFFVIFVIFLSLFLSSFCHFCYLFVYSNCLQKTVERLQSQMLFRDCQKCQLGIVKNVVRDCPYVSQGLSVPQLGILNLLVRDGQNIIQGLSKMKLGNCQILCWNCQKCQLGIVKCQSGFVNILVRDCQYVSQGW